MEENETINDHSSLVTEEKYTTVGKVIVDEMNQTNIYFYVIKFTILIGQSTIVWVKIFLPVLVPSLKQIIVFMCQYLVNILFLG
jgi:hypothetical protein